MMNDIIELLLDIWRTREMRVAMIIFAFTLITGVVFPLPIAAAIGFVTGLLYIEFTEEDEVDLKLPSGASNVSKVNERKQRFIEEKREKEKLDKEKQPNKDKQESQEKQELSFSKPADVEESQDKNKGKKEESKEVVEDKEPPDFQREKKKLEHKVENLKGKIKKKNKLIQKAKEKIKELKSKAEEEKVETYPEIAEKYELSKDTIGYFFELIQKMPEETEFPSDWFTDQEDVGEDDVSDYIEALEELGIKLKEKEGTEDQKIYILEK